MIISVTEKYHKEQPKVYLIDSDRLDAARYIDQAIIKAIAGSKSHCFVNATRWEQEGLDSHVNKAIKLKAKDKRPSVQSMDLEIVFEEN